MHTTPPKDPRTAVPPSPYSQSSVARPAPHNTITTTITRTEIPNLCQLFNLRPKTVIGRPCCFPQTPLVRVERKTMTRDLCPAELLCGRPEKLIKRQLAVVVVGRPIDFRYVPVQLIAPVHDP